MQSGPSLHLRTLLPLKSFGQRLVATREGRGSSHPFLSGDSFRALADHRIETATSDFDPRRVRAGSVIFCQSEYLGRLGKEVTSRFRGPATVLLGNSDRNLGEEVQAFSNQVNVSTVYAQNLTVKCSNVFPLPIGLENLHYNRSGVPKDFRVKRQKPVQKELHIGWSFAVENNPLAREYAREILVEHPLAKHFGRVSVSKHQKLVQQSAFLACPPGNGLDTHRVWEAMYLGTIPIVLRSATMEHFKDLGMPIWLVEDFGELAGKTREELQAIAEQMKSKFQTPWLWLPQWEKTIRGFSSQQAA